MGAMVGNGATLSVCYDCLSAEYGGVDVQSWDREPLGLISPDAVVTAGCLDCDPCGHPDCAEGSRVCDCGQYGSGHGFSWSACEGCGSTLGGDRFPLTVWMSA